MATPNVAPELDKPTHHILLSDGKVSVGLIAVDGKLNANPNAISRAPAPRTALKTASGSTKYSDFNYPWTPISQEDFSGGRGLKDFDLDTTRFYDDYRVNSLFGVLSMGPLERFSNSFVGSAEYMPGSVNWTSLKGSLKHVAIQLIASASITASDVDILIRKRGTPTGSLVVHLHTDSTGAPGGTAKTATVTVASVTDIVSMWKRLTMSSTLAMTAGFYYWVEVYSEGATDDDENCWQVATTSATNGNSSKTSTDGTTWVVNTDTFLYARVTPVKDNWQTIFYQYKGSQYCIRQKGTGAPKIYLNGDRGSADSNSTAGLSKLVDATKSWSTSLVNGRYYWQGAIVWIISGPGSSEKRPWRYITANDGTTLTVDTPWLITHTTDTNYVIIGSEKWQEITGHGLTVPVTGKPLVVNDIVYFPLGDDTVIRSMREFNSSGTWTREYRDEGTSTNKAVLLTTVRDSTNGLEIWRANNKNASGYISVSKASVVDYSTNLTFGAVEGTSLATLKDQWGKIINIAEYGDTQKYLWILREGTIMTINSGKPDEIPLSEMHSLMSYQNGRAWMTHNVYFYFNLGQRIEKYYSRSLEDVGPNRDDGLPADRAGYCSAMIGLPGMTIYGFNGESDKYSHVLANNVNGTPGGGYCEIFRAHAIGDELYDMQYQPMFGTTISGFWVAVGDDIVWIPFSVDKLSPYALYTHESVVTSGYCYASLYDIYKIYKAVKVFAENLVEDAQFIEMDYMVDNETEWTTIDEQINESVAEVNITDPPGGVSAKRLRWRMRMQTNDCTKTPVIKAIVIDAVSRIPIKFSYALTYRNADDPMNQDLNGDVDEMTAEEKQKIIDNWAQTLTPLFMRSIRRQYDKQYVFIDGVPTSPTMEESEGYLSRLTMVQL